MFNFKKSNNYPRRASKTLIDKKSNTVRPIVPANLDYAVRSVYPIVKTALTSPITVNTIYDLGLQSNISITLPSGKLGDFIQFDFISGAAAATLNVSSSNGLIGYDLIPEVSKIYSLYFDWGIIECDTVGENVKYGWRCNYSEYSIELPNNS